MHHNLIIKDGDTTKVVKEVLVDGIQFVDEKPREGSTNFVTSDGVNKAIGNTKESVDKDVQDLQEQIDDIAEKAGSGYIPKGEATVATLNGLSGQGNGELYTMTDAGTLTLGSLAVVAGDTVAWDATNSVWYKAMDYAPRQYGTNEVHNLPTTITAFRSDDKIIVDSQTNGTGAMDKNSLLAITKENALLYDVVSYSTQKEWENASSGVTKQIFPPSNVPAGTKISVKWESAVAISVNIFLYYSDDTFTQVNVSANTEKTLVIAKELNRINFVPYRYPAGVSTATFTGYFNAFAMDNEISEIEAKLNALNDAVISYSTQREWENASSGVTKQIFPPSNVPAGTKISVKWESAVAISVNIFLYYSDDTFTQVNVSANTEKTLVIAKELNRINFVPYRYPAGVSTATFTGYFSTHVMDDSIASLNAFASQTNYCLYQYDFNSSFSSVTAYSEKRLDFDEILPAGTILNYGWKSSTSAKCVIRLVYKDGTDYQLPVSLNGIAYKVIIPKDVVALTFTPYSYPAGTTQINFDVLVKTEGNDNAILNNGTCKNSNYNAVSKPIICFVFDDGAATDANIVEWMKPYGLVSTFALIGNVDPDNASWKNTIARYKNYCLEGHDVVCHGIVHGVSVDNIYGIEAVGLGFMNDKDSYKVLRSEKESMRNAGFSTDCLAYFNSTRYSPHVVNIVSGEFNFAVGSNAQNNYGVNTPDLSPIQLSRVSIDNAGQASVIRGLIDANLGKRVLIIIGTHSSSIGGAGKETATNVKDLFAYIADLRDKGLLLNMGFHDAVAMFYGGHNKVVQNKNSVINPDYGQVVVDSGSMSICTNVGSKNVSEVTIGGSVSSGSFRVNLKNNRDSESTYTEITLDGTESVEDVIDIICDKNSYQEATVLKLSATEFLIRYDVPKSVSVVFSNNSTSLSFSVDEQTAGADPTFS